MQYFLILNQRSRHFHSWRDEIIVKDEDGGLGTVTIPIVCAAYTTPDMMLKEWTDSHKVTTGLAWRLASQLEEIKLWAWNGDRGPTGLVTHSNIGPMSATTLFVNHGPIESNPQHLQIKLTAPMARSFMAESAPDVQPPHSLHSATLLLTVRRTCSLQWVMIG